MSARKLPSRSESERTVRDLERSRSWCATVGFGGLLFWLVGGGVLEGLQGFKTPLYLQDPIRREMWTLAHAHGTMFSLACLVLSLWVARSDGSRPAIEPAGVASGGDRERLPARARLADRLFAAGAALLPLGFLLGGIAHYESDPGLGILLVPLGGLLAASALVLMLSSGAARGRATSPSERRE